VTDITTRSGKGSPLTNSELDQNFTELNNGKAEVGANTDITSLGGVTGSIGAGSETLGVEYIDFANDNGERSDGAGAFALRLQR